MKTVQLEIPDPTALPVVTVDWDTGDTSVVPATRVVQIPVGVGVPGRDGATQPPAVTMHVQPTPASTWSFPHGLGRPAQVFVYGLDGKPIVPDIFSDDTTVVLTFSAPTAGKALTS